MARFAPHHTGQFIIKPLAVKRQRLWRIAAVLAVLLVPYLTFEGGRRLAGYSVVTSVQRQAELADQIDTLRANLSQVQRDWSDAKLALQAEQQAGKGWQQSLVDAQATIQKQQEELSFYRAIVKPEQTADTPSVQRLQIHPGEDMQHYQLQLMLIQPAQRTAQAQGELTLMVDGRSEGQPVRLTLEQIAPDLNGGALKFSYRYFQQLEQVIVLPEGFEPMSVQVEMRVDKQPEREQRFTWKLAE